MPCGEFGDGATILPALERNGRLPGCGTTCVNNRRVKPKMNSIIYLVGLVVVVMAILSFIGLA